MPEQAEIFPGIDWVAILNTGATGFAVIMLYISYQLMARAQKFIFEKNPGDFQSIDIFKAWSDLVKSTIGQIRYFMVLSAVFFFGGVFVILYQFQAESDIVLSVRPFDEPFPKVFVQSTQSPFEDEGFALLRVRSGQTIEVKADPIYTRMNELENELARVRASLQSTAARAARTSSEFGF